MSESISATSSRVSVREFLAPVASRAIFLGASVRGLRRFRPEVEVPLLAPDWGVIDRMVQVELDHLAEKVSAILPRIRSVPGRGSARAFPLFTYRTFSNSVGGTEDPIVVGIQFWGQDQRIKIHGDICGESSGKILFDATGEDGVVVEIDRVVSEARRIAEELGSRDQVVIQALSQPRNVSASV